ncbi:MAG: Uma2 family endonuclease [Saprospiraceae bacterium]|nr:Uma2 family endonuclease [Saprospiraceae bacterium]
MTRDALAAPPPASARSEKIALHLSDGEVFYALPQMTEAEFEEFCLANPNLRLEQDAHGNITILMPNSYDSGYNESEPLIDLGLWNRRTKLGKVFSSSTLFKLPDGSKRMPDAAWVSLDKHEQLSPRERKTFAHIVPDFVIEVRSPSDSLDALQTKMRAVWIANGVRLAWLLDPETQQAWLYRTDGTETHIPNFSQTLSGEDVLPGFELDLGVFHAE